MVPSGCACVPPTGVFAKFHLVKSRRLRCVTTPTAPLTDLSGAKRRILERLKRADTATAPEIAAEFGLTDTAVRQHLEVLEAAQLVRRTIGPSAGRGRPPVRWQVTERVDALFADRHADLTVDLIAAIRTTLGDDALRQVVRARADRQLATYRAALDAAHDTAERVELLAQLRSREGYLAEAIAASTDEPSMSLVEHHCPIRSAADECDGLCDAELHLFRSALGDTVQVEREQHVLMGDHRCAYRITMA